MAETDSPEPSGTETAAAQTAPDDASAPSRAGKKTRGRRTRVEMPAALAPTERTFLPVEDAAAWFVSDLMEVSGFVRTYKRHRTGYSHYRPILTKPDPWYFAGLVALEACKIIDLFPQEKADALLRQVLVQADRRQAP